MKMNFWQRAGLFTVVGCFILGVFLSVVPNAAAQDTSLLAPDTISAEKAKMFGYVENHITNKFPPMLRRTIEWGKVQKNKNQYTIRYQCEAVAINSTECLVYCWDFTFDEVGNFVTFKKVSGFPKRPGKPFLKVAPNNPDKENTKKDKPKENAPEVKVSASDHKEAGIAFEKANKLVKDRDFAAAEIQFKEAFKKNPNNYMALLGLGDAQFQQHLHEEAQKTFLKCTEMRPRDSRPLEALGLIARDEGDEEKMVEWWKKSVEIDKQSYVALKGLGAYYAAKGDTKNAAVYYKIYLKTNTKDIEIRRILENLNKKE
ncbi:MAG: tetratricopeptide repeat protein [Planctomycetaceae bacterium]|jgi:tetratricopeptide (TPR) repeat protein|nr:tetratricopeptide repeat protein [Planctomycetaceae bacterium]